jgi:hypothetical protein
MRSQVVACDVELLTEYTRQRFPQYRDSTFEIRALKRGGSDRRYYRVRRCFQVSADRVQTLWARRELIELAEEHYSVIILNDQIQHSIGDNFRIFSCVVQFSVCSRQLERMG